MSLDVSLELVMPQTKPAGSGIFVRQDGQTIEISREEWDRSFPGREPVVATTGEDTAAYRANITHNLTSMAEAAGIYRHLWRPEEIGIAHAKDLIGPLTEGLSALRAEPDKFKALNPPNGWGDYAGLVRFTADYLTACQRYPEAMVRVSR